MTFPLLFSSLQTTKLLTAVVIFLCGFLSTVSPLFVAGKNEALFSAGNMMAAGVLLSAGLVHQLADSASSSLDTTANGGYPWSFFICGLTFILFLIFEESVHLLLAEGDHSHSNGNATVIEMEGRGHNSHVLGGHSCQGSIIIPRLEQISGEPIKEETTTIYGTSNTSHSSHSHQHHHHDGSETQPLTMRMRRASSAATGSWRASKLSVSVFGDPRESLHHHHDDHIAEHLHGSLLASLMLLIALSLHSILAGLSIGLVADVHDILSTAVAIVAHKVFAGYALGSTMVAADLDYHRCVFLGIVFSLSTPLGILIGMGLTSSSSYKEDSVSVGIVQAVVAGTFLYVSIFEVGMKELLICRDNSGPLRVSLSQKQLEALKLFCMLLGFLGMSFLAEFV